MPSPPSPRQHDLLTKISDMTGAIQHLVLDFLEEVDALGPDVNYFSEREVFKGCNKIIDEIDATMRSLHDINNNGIESRKGAATMRMGGPQPQYTNDIGTLGQNWQGSDGEEIYSRPYVVNMNRLNQFSIPDRMKKLLVDITNFIDSQLSDHYRGKETRELGKVVSRFIIKVHELLPDAERLVRAMGRSQVSIELDSFGRLVRVMSYLESSR